MFCVCRCEAAERKRIMKDTMPDRGPQMLWKLFCSNFALSAVTFGGGFVIASLMKKKYVDQLGWFEEDEMLDLTAIAQSSPGPIPINISVLIGYRLYGVLGSLVAVLAMALPPFLIISVISLVYDAFRTNPVIATALAVMRVGVAAVIFDVVWGLAKRVVGAKRFLYLAELAAAFAAKVVFDVSAMLIIVCCLLCGILDYCISCQLQKRSKRRGEEVC